MKTKLKHTAALLLSALLPALSCSREEPVPAPAIVVEGWVEAGRPPVVLLHQPVRPGDDISDIEALMRRKIISLGKVTLSDGENSVVLTGMRDTSLIPSYKYSTSRIMPVSGREYSIKVEYGGVEASAKTRLLEAVAIDSVHVRGNGAGKSTVEIFWTDNPGEDDWYCIFFRPHGRQQWVASGLGAMDDSGAGADGVMSSLVIPRGSLKYGKLGNDGLATFSFSGAGSLDVRLCHIDREAYIFWKSFSDNAGNNFFSNVESPVRSNVSGGLGYFTGLASSVVTVDL